MHKIIKHIIFLSAILAVHFSIINYLLPYYWGAESTVSKHTLNPKKVKKANVLFFGSSRTLYHVNASLFSKKTNTLAYNLGIQDGRTLEMGYQINHFVRENPVTNKKKYIIYELSPFENLSRKKIMHTNRIRHFWNLNTLSKSLKNNFTIANYGEMGRSAVNFLEFFFKIDFIKEYYLLRKHKETLLYGNKFGMDEMVRCNGCFSNANVSLSRNEKSTKQFEKKHARIIKYYQELNKMSDKDILLKDLLIKEVTQVRKIVEQNGFELIIINQTGSQQYQIAALKDLEKQGYTCLDLGDPNKYPELYDPNNMFDIAHLTKKGARVFTLLLIEEFNKLNIIKRKE